jgi:glycosyltransferase involved in cell wall biosynthesis
MVILTGFYNAEQYIEKCLGSIMGQTYTAFTCYITHDLSTDNSVSLVKEMIKDDPRFILVPDADKKLYQAGNFDRVIRNNPNISDNEVLIEVDGDDWLPHANVFKKIHEVYLDDNVWITNGSFRYSNGQFGFSSKQKIDENLRKAEMTCSHLRTWRAFLWRAIKEEDLKDENGNYWQWSGDLCFMFPMLEMSGDEHYTFIKDILYTYNAENPINEHKVNIVMVNNHASRIRAKQKYNKLNGIS